MKKVDKKIELNKFLEKAKIIINKTKDPKYLEEIKRRANY